MPDQVTLMYGAIFLAVLLLVEGALVMFRDARQRAERLASRRVRLRSARARGEAPVKIRRASASGRGPVAALARMLEQSGTSLTAGRFLFIAALLSVALWGAVVALTPASRVLTMPLAISLGCAGPLLFVVVKRRRRLKRFAEQLPDALDMMVRSLRAGHPIKSAMALVAREMSEPIANEFGIAVDEMTYGLELGEALENLRNRIPHPDLHYTVVAINIQNSSGGNLGEVLSNLASVIRDRYRLYKKVRALSSEGRLAGYVIAGVPFFIAFMMTVNKRDYYSEASAHPSFPIIVTVAVFLYVSSVIAIYKIVHIRV
jgi:tight adherence protein B